MRLSVQSRIKDIYESEQGRAVLNKYMPKLTRTPSFQMTYGMSFETLCRFKHWKLSPEKMAQAAAELENIEV